MPIKPQPGHWYERRDGEVVQYDGPNGRSGGTHFPHRVGIHSYTDRGRYMAGRNPHSWDLVKDLGTTDPRLKKPRKAPAKVRKVRMWFVEIDMRDGAAPWFYNRPTKDSAEGLRESTIAHGIACGPAFSQMIEVPVKLPKKTKA